MVKEVKVASEVTSDESALESAWVLLRDEMLRRQNTPGQVAIPSGKDTGLWVRVNADCLPFAVAFDLLEAGVRKPLTDISVDRKIEGDSWQNAHERRLKRVANWKGGDFSVRGGSRDELGTQMKIEFTEMLKLAGLNPDKHKELFKGTVVQMFDACEAAKIKFDRDAKLAEVRDKAQAKLAKRGIAAAELDVSSITL
jgi:hypothetical protein